MRWTLGIGGFLLMCGGAVAVAADGGQKPGAIAASKDLTVASVVDRAGEKQAAEQVPSEPVTQTTKVVPPKPAALPPSLIATIDLSTQAMRVTANGRLVGNWAISSGASGFETPTGRFRPSWTSKMHYSRKYNNAPMPYSVFFNGGIATHGTTATGRLGAPASHGCIRLRTDNARKFYQLVHQHGYKRTRIVVTGRAKQTLTASRGQVRRERSRSSRSNSFSAPVAVPRGRNQSSRAQRYSLEQYDRYRAERHEQRVQRYYQSRRRAHNGYRNPW